jgi:hypothetical protein
VVQTLNSNLQQISFHDPEGNVFEVHGRLIRRVSLQGGYRLQKFLSSQLATDLTKEKMIPATRVLLSQELSSMGIQSDEGAYIWFEHDKIQFISYAYEWIPEMLLAAAELTLSLVKRLNAQGWDLKDGSANNVVFTGSKPVFIDLCSIIERRNEPFWWPKGQFERHFILPLMAYIYRALPPNHTHFSNIDGLEPLALSGLLGFKKWTSALGIKHCALPVLLSKSGRTTPHQESAQLDSRANVAAQEWQLQSLESSLAAIKRKLPKPASKWHAYTSEREHYSEGSLLEKRNIVERWIKAASPSTVLDLGANTGEFTILAAKKAIRVLAFEKDMDSARLIYQNTKVVDADCQVILQDLGNPSPALGWRQIEKKSMNQRIAGEVDCVLALALLHHWMVSSGIPLPEILFQLAQWTRRYAIVEYVSPADPMFKLISAQRRVEFSWLDLSEFRRHLTCYFSVIEEVEVGETQRTLFYCERLA